MKPSATGRPGITARQARVVDFIRKFLAEKGFPPTQAEIAAALGFRSQNAAAEHVRLLAKKGVLTVEPGLARGLRLTEPKRATGTARAATLPHAAKAATLPHAARAATLPLIGEVAAGQPILATQNVEREVEIDPSLFSARAHFLLRVRGESMVEAGILPGDLVAVHRTPTAREGEIAVVRLDDDVTVKRWRTRVHGHARTRGQPRKEVVLEPANAALSAIVVDPTRVQVAVEGIVVGLLRRALRP